MVMVAVIAINGNWYKGIQTTWKDETLRKYNKV